MQLSKNAYLQEGDIGSNDDAKGEGRPDLFDESSICAVTHRENGDAMIAPDLLGYVSKEVDRDASILKQVRKAREELESTRGKGGKEDNNNGGESLTPSDSAWCASRPHVY